MKPRIEAVAAALWAAGCSFAIGDIPLPQSAPHDTGLLARDMRGADGPIPLDLGGMDLGPDGARPPDAASDAPVPPPDGPRPVDAAPTDGPVPDMPPDAALPPVVDIGTLAGVWHLYGAVSAEVDFVFEAQLTINQVGVARLLAPDGTALNDPAPLRPDPIDGRLVELHLFPIAGSVRGTLDPVSGVGVLASSDDPSFVLAVRPGEVRADVPTGVFSHAWMAVNPGFGEIGVLSRVNELYSEGDRRTSGGQSPQAQVFEREDADPARHRMAPAEGTPPELDRVMTGVGGFGAVGLVRRLGVGVGLAVAWSAEGSNRRGPPAQRAFCAAMLRRELGVEVRSTGAEFRVDSTVLFDNGDVAEVFRLPGLFEVDGAESLIGVANGMALVEPDERAYMLLPATINPRSVDWGMAACVRVEPQ